LRKTIIILASISALSFLLMSSLYIVNSDEYAIVSRFGKVVRSIDEPGLKLKWPSPVDNVYYVDKRSKIFQPEPVEVFLPDENNVVTNITLSYFVIWQISDALKYFETLRDESLAEFRMENNLRSIVGNKAGQYPFKAFISTDPSTIQSGEIAVEITGAINKAMESRFGISIAKVDFTKIILPEQNKNKVFERMVAERNRISSQYRAEGEEQAKIIISEANKERSLLLSVADLEAAKIISDAEAEAAKIYAQAYSKNPEFYRFWRRLKSLEESYKDNSTFILSSDDPLMLDGYGNE